MRIAHVSDLHLLDLRGVVPWRLLGRRAAGYVNVQLRRRAVHRPELAQAVLAEIRRRDCDHVVVTGDLSNLALEREFELGRRFLEDQLGFAPDRVSVVPGNHDAYTAGAYRSERFRVFFAPFMSSDLSLPAGGGGPHGLPYVRLRGPVAIIGLGTAVPCPPLVSSGQLGAPQRDTLRALLAHEQVRTRMPVVIQHHPCHDPRPLAWRLIDGLADDAAECAILARLRRGLVLHGHLHRRIRRSVPTACGHLEVIGAPSASLRHRDERRGAGFNLYELDGDGRLARVELLRLVPATGQWVAAGR
ncbi:MAG: metallophosphoesterase [Deltaproteobacteria bacterium]|nr:metallophosphoesterase [Deltaproteobacteria bacterium]